MLFNSKAEVVFLNFYLQSSVQFCGLCKGEREVKQTAFVCVSSAALLNFH